MPQPKIPTVAEAQAWITANQGRPDLSESEKSQLANYQSYVHFNRPFGAMARPDAAPIGVTPTGEIDRARLQDLPDASQVRPIPPGTRAAPPELKVTLPRPGPVEKSPPVPSRQKPRSSKELIQAALDAVREARGPVSPIPVPGMAPGSAHGNLTTDSPGQAAVPAAAPAQPAGQGADPEAEERWSDTAWVPAKEEHAKLKALVNTVAPHSEKLNADQVVHFVRAVRGIQAREPEWKPRFHPLPQVGHIPKPPPMAKPQPQLDQVSKALAELMAMSKEGVRIARADQEKQARVKVSPPQESPSRVADRTQLREK